MINCFTWIANEEKQEYGVLGLTGLRDPLIDGVNVVVHDIYSMHRVLHTTTLHLPVELRDLLQSAVYIVELTIG